MVRPGAALGDQLVTHAAGKRQVGDAVAVEMAELAPAQTELDTPETVRRGLHSRPRPNGRGDVLSGGMAHDCAD